MQHRITIPCQPSGAKRARAAFSRGLRFPFLLAALFGFFCLMTGGAFSQSLTQDDLGDQRPVKGRAGSGAPAVTPSLMSLSCDAIVINSTLGNPSSGMGYTAATGTQTNRIFRNGIVSSCTQPKGCPGTLGGNYMWDSYSFTNTCTAARCVTVSLKQNSGSQFNTFSETYLGSYNTSNLCANYLADEGVTWSIGGTGSYSFNLASGATAVIVVNNIVSNSETDYTLTVEGLDEVAPTISVSLDPSQLWPPNHTMQTITATVTVADNCPGVTYVLTSITSNEPDNGLGDGDKPNDIQDADYGTADTQFSLRAERSGAGTGRVYTVTYTATDACGHSATASATVTVPHDMSKTAPGGSPVPAELTLEQNYPNPFNPTTSIAYGLPERGAVSLRIYDINSRIVATLVDMVQDAGEHQVLFDASALASGTYLCRLEMDGHSVSRSMILNK